MFSCTKRFEDFVPFLSRPLHFASSQRNANSLRSVVGPMDCEMAPPRATIVPEMVIGVFPVNARGELAAEMSLSGKERRGILFFHFLMQFLWDSVTASGLVMVCIPRFHGFSDFHSGEILFGLFHPHIESRVSFRKKAAWLSRHLGFSKPGCRILHPQDHS